MARDTIKTQVLEIDNTQSVGTAVVTKKAVTVANGIKIEDALGCKQNTLFIIVENTGAAASTITLKKGDYINRLLKDLPIAVDKGINAIQLHDPARFQNRDGSVDIDFASGFTGNIFAVGKRVGLKPIA